MEYPKPINELLERVRANAWFSHVGEPLKEGEHYDRVYDWADAVKSLSSRPSGDAFNDMGNDSKFGTRQPFEDLDLRAKWKQVGEQFEDDLQVVLDRAVEMAPAPARKVKELRTTIGWCVILAAREVWVLEHLERPIFVPLVDLYLRGHLPCGWNGDYPQGKLVVF